MRIVLLMRWSGVVFLLVSIFGARAGEKQICYELPHCFAVEDPQCSDAWGNCSTRASCWATTVRGKDANLDPNSA